MQRSGTAPIGRDRRASGTAGGVLAAVVIAAVSALAVAVLVPAASAHGDDATMALVSSTGSGRSAVVTVSLTYDNDSEPVSSATVTVTGDNGAGATLDPVPMAPGSTPGQFTATVELPAAGTWNLRATSVTPSATVTFTHEVAADAGGSATTPESSPESGTGSGGGSSTTSVDGGQGDEGTPVISPAPEPESDDEDGGALPWILIGVGVVVCVGLGVVFVLRGRDQGPID